MPRLNVQLPIAPRQKDRPRATLQPISARCGKCGVQKMRPSIYKPKKSEKWENDVAIMVKQAAREIGLGSTKFNGPLRVVLDFVKERVAAQPKPSNVEQRAAGNWHVSKEAWDAGSRVPAPTRPDIDNYEKAILDALGKAGIWWDDAQVCETRVRKWYAAAGEDPCVHIRVEQL